MYKNNTAKLLFFLTIIIIAIAVWYYNFYYENRAGVKQPIPFSHRLHVTEKKINCFMCHDNAMKGEHAGIPPLETCMLCHSKIITLFPPIAKLRKAYSDNKPIEWIKVTYLPDYVFFNHFVHIRKNIDCSECHGNIAIMDRVVETKKLTMGFCVNCHKQNNASTDCFICHR